MWKLTLVSLCAIAGCLDSSLVVCTDGLACPVTDRCDETHHTCVLPEQLLVCLGGGDGADCVAGAVSGGCFDGVCLPRGCGNHVVEIGEMCDDGNQISGDGCSGDCRSTERCGNGFLDPGEACDDGDLISHDGCDSQCNPEGAAWSAVIAISPDFIDARYSAYDAARGKLVAVGLRGTWEWDGMRWTLTGSSGGSEAVFYDPDRQRVELISSGGSSALQLYAWVDGQWLRIGSEDGPVVPGFVNRLAAVYDLANHRVMVIETGESDPSLTWTVDAEGAWSPLLPLPGTPGASTAAFDVASGEVVVETQVGAEWIYDGAVWSTAPTGFGPAVSMAYDPDRGHLILVDNQSLATYERIGTTWEVIEGTDAPCRKPTLGESLPLYADPISGTLALFSSDASEICTWDGSWTKRAPEIPFRPIAATYDPLTRSFAVLHNPHPEDPDSPTELWELTDDRWHRIETLHPPTGRTGVLAVYSAGRAATVLYGERPEAPPDGGTGTGDCMSTEHVADTWSFDGSDWTWLGSLTTTAPPCSKSAATYDAEHGRVLLAMFGELWSLGDAADAWVRLEPALSSGQVLGAGWDARNASVVAVRLAEEGEAFSPMFELRGSDWTPIEVLPGALNSSADVFVSDQRAGAVILIERAVGAAWERLGVDWVKLPPVPAPLRELFTAWTAYRPVDGSVLFVGRTQGGVFASVLTRTSVTPFESCQPGEDLDGDGLAGCDDPDCYWMCSRCLPHTTCL